MDPAIFLNFLTQGQSQLMPGAVNELLHLGSENKRLVLVRQLLLAKVGLAA